MPRTTRLALLAVASAATVSLGACGEDDASPTAAKPTATAHSTGHSGGGGTTSEGAALDRGFVAAMVPHHESAIDMAEIAVEQSESEYVKTLAKNILGSQLGEIDVMRKADERLASKAEIGELGVPGHGDTDLEALRSAKDFDIEFVRMMLPHHESALPMAQVELDKGTDPELKGVARAIISAQKKEIAEMKAFLALNDVSAARPRPNPHTSTSGQNPAHTDAETE